MELPAEMRAKPRFRNLQRMAVDDAFKEQEHPFRIAVVCAMWLTGFDVPSLSTLYLDKPLKAHTLMQAIARANRVNEGKNNGLIVDYCGVLKHLRRALATFAGTQSGGQGGAGGEIDPARPHEELLADLAEAIAMVRNFLRDGGAPLDDVIRKLSFKRNAAIVACKEVANENDETRKRFEVLCREVFKKFKAGINVAGVNAHRADRDAIDVIYRSLQRDREQADIRGIIRRLQRRRGRGYRCATGPSRRHSVYLGHQRDRLRPAQAGVRAQPLPADGGAGAQAHRGRATPAPAGPQSAADRLPAALRGHRRRVQPREGPGDHRAHVRGTSQVLRGTGGRGEPRTPGGAGRGVAGSLRPAEEAGSGQGRHPAHQDGFERAAANASRRRSSGFDQWREKEATQSAVKVAIHDFLYSDETGLPAGAYSDGEVEATSEAVFAHVYRAYPTVPSPFYDDVTAA